MGRSILLPSSLVMILSGMLRWWLWKFWSDIRWLRNQQHISILTIQRQCRTYWSLGLESLKHKWCKPCALILQYTLKLLVSLASKSVHWPRWPLVLSVPCKCMYIVSTTFLSCLISFSKFDILVFWFTIISSLSDLVLTHIDDFLFNLWTLWIHSWRNQLENSNT
jgi:hypothetical protein